MITGNPPTTDDEFAERLDDIEGANAAPESYAPGWLGGPNPFPGENWDCLAQAHGYYCTRSDGHEGTHVAFGSAVYAFWPPYLELPMDGPQ